MAESQGNLGNTKRPPYGACFIPSLYVCLSLPDLHVSRSHMQPALKSKSFDDRMEKATKAQAIKKLQVELKEEKQAETQR